jgi:excisionase family DNA binding protein
VTELLTVPEVAVRLRCSTRTVRREIKAGRLRAIYVGDRPLVPDREVEAYISASWRVGRGA